MIRKIALLLILCIFLAADARAFHHPLSSGQVDEAYLLGQNPDKRQAFFDRYVHYLKPPDVGPDVHLIEFRTPYELVARLSQERWANYHMLDAEQEYASHPEEVIVRILLCGTFDFGFGQPPQNPPPGKTWEDFLHGFDFRVSQASPISYRKLTVLSAGCANFDGADALLHFDADQFAPGNVKIMVVAPRRPTVFDHVRSRPAPIANVPPRHLFGPQSVLPRGQLLVSRIIGKVQYWNPLVRFAR